MKLRTLLWLAVGVALVWTAGVFGLETDSTYRHSAGYFNLEIPRGWNVTSEAHAAGGVAYRDPQGRFAVQVPAGWNAAQAEGGARLSSGSAYANVMVMEGVQGGWDLGDQIVGQVRQQWRNFREIDRGERRLGPLLANFGLYTGVNPKGVSAFLKVYVAPGPGGTFVLLLSWPVDQLASMAGDITQIEQSFSVESAGGFAGVPAAGTLPGSGQAGPGSMPGLQPGSPQTGPHLSPNRAILGVICRDLTPQDMATVAAAVSQGTLIVQVGPNTPAARAGLQPNDVIDAIDRQPVLNTADLIRIIGGYNPGAIVEIFVIRQGRPQAFRVELAGQGQAEATRTIPSGAGPPARSSAGQEVQPPWTLSPLPDSSARPTMPSSRLKAFQGPGFSLSIPENWISAPSRTKGIYLFGATQDMGRATDKEEILLGMNAGWDWINAPDVKTCADRHLDATLKQNLGVKILARQQTVVARLSAESILIENPSSVLGEPELAWIVIARPARGLFFVHLVSPKKDFNALRSLFGRIVESVQFSEDSSSTLWEKQQRQ